MSEKGQPAAGQGSASGARPDTDLNPGDQAAPGTPGTGENVCPRCAGTGKLEGSKCPHCGGTGVVVEGIGGA